MLTALWLCAALSAGAQPHPGEWVDFTNPDTYTLRGGGIWELKVFTYSGTKYLYAANVTNSFMRCEIPENANETPTWTAIQRGASTCCVDAYNNGTDHCIAYGTGVGHLNPAIEGFFFSTNNGSSWTPQNVTNWHDLNHDPIRYQVEDVAILRDPAVTPSTNYWILITAVPFSNESSGIYHYYSGTYHYEHVCVGDQDYDSRVHRLFADLDPTNDDHVKAYACGDGTNTGPLGGYGLFHYDDAGGTYGWRAVDGTDGCNVIDVYQDEDDLDYLFISVIQQSDGSNRIFYRSERGTGGDDWIQVESYYSQFGQEEGGQARDMVADYTSATEVEIYAAVGLNDPDDKGCYHLEGNPTTGSWEHPTNGLTNMWPNKEMLVHDAANPGILYWGSWGAGVYEYDTNHTGAPWVAWSQTDASDYNSEFNKGLVVDHEANPDKAYVATQGAGIWQGTASPYCYTYNGTWNHAGLNNQQWQNLEMPPFDDDKVFASCWNGATPLYWFSTSPFGSSSRTVDLQGLIPTYNFFEVTAMKSDDDHDKLYLAISCWTYEPGNEPAENRQDPNAIKVYYLNSSGTLNEVGLFNPATLSIPISDIELGSYTGGQDLWVTTGRDIWQDGGLPNLYHYDASATAWTQIYSQEFDAWWDHLQSAAVIPTLAGDRVFYTCKRNTCDDQIPSEGGIYLYDASIVPPTTTNITDGCFLSGALANFKHASYQGLLLIPYHSSWILLSVGSLITNNNAPETMMFYSPYDPTNSPYFHAWHPITQPAFATINYIIGGRCLNYDEDHHHVLTAGGRADMEYIPSTTDMDLSAHWSMVSLDIHPWNNTMEAVTGGIEDSLVCAQDAWGNYYYPDSINNIGDWADLAAYKVNTTGGANLGAWGDSIDVHSTVVLYPENPKPKFNLIAYLPDDTMSVDYALGDVDCLIIVKDDQGHFWGPGMDSNPFDMWPGKGYAVGVSDTVNYVYPDPPSGNSFTGGGNKPSGANKKVTSLEPAHFQFMPFTIDFYPILIDELIINGEYPAIGDEVGVFAPNDLCVGAEVYEGEFPVKIAAWKDDPCTEEVDGYNPGETLSFKFYDASAGIEVPLEMTAIAQSMPPANAHAYTQFEQGFYAEHHLQASYVLPGSYALLQNYPNPFNPATTIRYDLPFESIVKLEIFDLMGRKVITLVDGKQAAGFRAVRWEGKSSFDRELSSGVYFYRLTADATQLYMGKKEHYVKSHKMVLIK